MTLDSAANARLGHSGSPWFPRTVELGVWIQVDLGDIIMVTKIATQCGQQSSGCVTEYKVSYSLNGGHFNFYRMPLNNSFDQVGRKKRIFSSCNWVTYVKELAGCSSENLTNPAWLKHIWKIPCHWKDQYSDFKYIKQDAIEWCHLGRYLKDFIPMWTNNSTLRGRFSRSSRATQKHTLFGKTGTNILRHISIYVVFTTFTTVDLGLWVIM